jgi:hypothetical protein
MGMSGLIFENVDKFWNIADKTIGECESFQEFANKMIEHNDLLEGSDEVNDIEDILYEAWQEKPSKYTQ